MATSDSVAVKVVRFDGPDIFGIRLMAGCTLLSISWSGGFLRFPKMFELVKIEDKLGGIRRARKGMGKFWSQSSVVEVVGLGKLLNQLASRKVFNLSDSVNGVLSITNAGDLC